jgi:uncharacterized protein involved in outer membrane biogenesis
MKKLLKIIAVLIVLVAIAFGGVFWYANRYLQSPAFKAQVLATAKQTLGAEVKIEELNISVLSGVSLKGIVIGNPPGFAGNLLTADAFTLRYKLLPLLRQRVEITQLTVTTPAITLTRNDKQEWSYEKLGGTNTNAAGGASSAASSAPPLAIALSRLELDHGQIAMNDEAGKALVAVSDLNLASGVEYGGGKLTGTGKASIGKMGVANALFITGIASPITYSAEQITLDSLTGKLAGGTVSGNLLVKVLGGTKYGVNLQIKDADMATLLQEAGTKPVMTGKMQVTTKLDGTAGLSTIAGNGHAEITDGKLVGVPILELLSTLLQVPELRALSFTETKVEFTMGNNELQTPVIKLVGPLVRLTGKGAVALADNSLNHDFTLALAPAAADRMPSQVRDIFEKQADGFYAISFHVSGTYSSPKTDLTERLAKGAVNKLIDKGLKSLFK